MASTRFSFPSGTVGATVNLASSGGEQFMLANVPTFLFEASHDGIDPIGAVMVRGTDTSGGTAYWQQDVSGVTAAAADIYLVLWATPSGDLPLIWMGDGSTRAVEIQIRSNGRLRLLNTGSTPWVSSGVLPLNVLLRIAVYATPHASTGTMKAAWYYGFEASPQEASGLLTDRNIGVITAIRHGFKARTVTVNADVTILSYAWDDAAVDFPTALPEPPPPTVKPMFFGADAVTNMFVGADEVLRVYAGAIQIWPPGGRILSIRSTGTAFAPKVELVAESEATITWESTGATIGGTQIAPTFSWGSGGVHEILMTVDQPQDVITLNFGFNHLQDEGRYNVGSAYNYTPQPVTNVAGLTGFPNLQRFLAATSTLTGDLNFSGCANLEFIECYQSSVSSVVVDGCDSLIRLCLEACAVTYLDLNPVRLTLRDLRCAVQSGAVLEFEPLSGPLAELYHYCIRSNLITNNIPMSQLPKIEQWWVWNTNISSASIDVEPTSTVFNSCQAEDIGLNATAVNRIINGIFVNVPDAYGQIDLTGNAAPTGTALTRAATIDARAGWTCEVAS